MGLREEISTRVAAISGIGLVEGTSLFIGNMPDSPDLCGGVYGYAGRGADTGFGTAGIQHEYPGVQVRVRGAAYDTTTPEAKIQSIFQDLAKIQAATLSGTKYYFMSAVGSPFEMDRDERARVIWAVNFIADKALS